MSRRSRCFPGQEFVISRSGRRIPAHTPKLKGRCKCKPCQFRRWWTPERRAARGQLIRRRKAEGTWATSSDPNRGRASLWRAEEDEALARLVGTMDVASIIVELEKLTGYPRSPSAIKHRIERLGLSRIALRPYSTTEVGRIFGLSRGTVLQRFVNRGLLVGRKFHGGPRGFLWFFDRPALEALVRDHPEAYDVERITDLALRALATAAHRGRRPLPTREVEILTGVNFRQLCRWYADGRVPSARRVAGIKYGRFGTWLIDPSDLDTVRRLKAEHDARQRRRAEACPSGHPRTVDNLYVEPGSGHRKCLPCRREKKAS